MKKLVLLFAAAVMTMSASAQVAIEDSKTFDNMYVGINGGLATKTTGHKWMPDANPNIGVRIGKWFTPVFGVALDGTAYLSNKGWAPKSTGTFVRYSNVGLIGTVNLTNWFGGYPGSTRCFELIALYGFGWGHGYGAGKTVLEDNDQVTSKVGLDFALNLGAKKAWQIYIEPSINYAIAGTGNLTGNDQVQYNLHRSAVQLNAGIIYKFKNSNGTHGFKTYDVGALIDENNRLMAELEKKPKEVIKEVVKEVVKEIPAPAPAATIKEVRVENLVFVTFAQGKSELTADAKKALDKLKSGSHVQIVGTASPEGNAELNQKLSQARAESVAEYVKTKGVVVDEAIGKGVQGNTSNRMAIVYVK